MIKLAICDDEPVYQKEVARLAKEYGEYHHVELSISVYSSGVQVLDANEHYDIFILDILMPGLSGMELASDLRRMDDAASIIFLTSSPEFAIEGYSVHALAYLLKPVKREKLFKALDHALAHRCKQTHDEILVRSDSKLMSISLSSIEYIEARQEKLVYYLCSGQIIESIGTLFALEQQLSGDSRFIKPHRSYLVNMTYIQGLDGKGIRTSACLQPVPIARGHFADIKKAYLTYMTFAMKRGE